MRILIDGIVVQCCIGNITAQQDICAIVNPAGSGLTPGPGVSVAIHAKAGPELHQECITRTPVTPGMTFLTPGFLLPNKYVLHCLPPQGRGELAARQLEQCYTKVLLLADEKEISSIAFPSLVPGSVGSPPISTAAIALGAVRRTAPHLRYVHRIRFVLFDRNVFIQYRNLLAANPESTLEAKITG